MGDRSEIFNALRANPEVSVLIIGAGINGIGTFRDLALQGVDVLLVDRRDFCSGASAASSHMVHGGIRYLENGEFRLVREAVRERNHLIQNAPHYVKPLKTTIPIFKWFSGLFNAPMKFLGIRDHPSERGALVIKIGLQLYDSYTRSQGTVPKHQMKLRQKSLEQFPQLNPEIICTATYYDAAMSMPERICIDLILDAEADSSEAKAINYVQAVGASGDAIALRDELTSESFNVKPKLVINAAGPWIDITNKALGQETRFIGGTKGSHLVLHHPHLYEAIRDHEFFFENEDGRIVLIYPLLGKVLVGTSDIRIEDPDQARCTEEEVDYFLVMIHKVFPTIEVNRSHIVHVFSGVRPLHSSEASHTGQISRDHSIRVVEDGEDLEFPIFCLVGGKWTTYRYFSEQVTDRVLAHLGLNRRNSTEDLPIGGGRGYPEKGREEEWLDALQEKFGTSREQSKALFDRYGTRSAEVAAFISEVDDAPLRHHPDFSRREVLFLVEEEKVLHLDDLVFRRSSLAKLGELTPELLTELSKVLGDALSWTQDTREWEIARTLRFLRS
ncbi:MAG: FAD-dependent oxidoreductase [Anaerolineales bacterium]|nr:FAD-dependent oxidoreductase [Anaerolineales bacterium]